MSRVAIIPARGGSKGVPRKNIRDLGGKPLIQWTIEAARASNSVDRVIVSTDDDEIADVCRDLGAEVLMRPEELATDEAPMMGVDQRTTVIKASPLFLAENAKTFDGAADVDPGADTISITAHGFLTGQPLTYNNNINISSSRLLELQAVALRALKDVRIIPQTHRFLALL